MGERREILSKLCDPIPVLTVGSHFFSVSFAVERLGLLFFQIYGKIGTAFLKRI